jgi:hypothetical protein
VACDISLLDAKYLCRRNGEIVELPLTRRLFPKIDSAGCVDTVDNVENPHQRHLMTRKDGRSQIRRDFKKAQRKIILFPKKMKVCVAYQKIC